MRTVKCAYCGREKVEVTPKGYMRPHVQPSGGRCLQVLIPGGTERAEGGYAKVKRQIKREERRRRGERA